MTHPDHGRVAQLRQVINDFLAARIEEKLAKHTGTDDASVEKRAHLRVKFEYPTWLESAAQRVQQIQVVTHSIKPIHPRAQGTNIYCAPTTMTDTLLVGTRCLGTAVDVDVVGNAAALDVHKFLSLPFEGSTLLGLMLSDDIDLAAALSEDAAHAKQQIKSFVGIFQPRGDVETHSLAKQVYWSTDGDSTTEEDYHLLAPLFATSLAHRVYKTIETDRFSESSKAARQARRGGTFNDCPVHEYPSLAVQKLGGTKPQNISQLNSERRGVNYLLASLPPRWKSADIKPILKVDSMFQRFERRSNVARAVRELRAFLQADPSPTVETRKRRDAIVRSIVEEFMIFTIEMRTLPPGWSKAVECALYVEERHWLDPEGLPFVTPDGGSAHSSAPARAISEGFGRWLNRKLRDPLPMGDPEFLHWSALAQAELALFDLENDDEY